MRIAIIVTVFTFISLGAGQAQVVNAVQPFGPRALEEIDVAGMEHYSAGVGILIIDAYGKREQRRHQAR